MSLDFRQDFLLNQTISLRQPVSGYRVAVDPVFLAASVDKAKGKIIDVGCGIGAISLCLAHRIKDIKIDGIDIQKELIAFAEQNAQDNGFKERLNFFQADLAEHARTYPNMYDCVITNPPYFKSDQSNKSPNPTKAMAHHDLSLSHQDWVKHCFKLLKSKGYLYMIFPFADLPTLLSTLGNIKFSLRIFPLWPKRVGPKNKVSTKRVLLRFQKDSKAPSQLLQGLILHEEDGQYTGDAEDVLREGKEIFS
jgi:tRNA1(Val) A37 N6-methylase TrmN6